MQLLKEKRELFIEGKVFTKVDIKSLIKLLIKSSAGILDKSKEIRRQDLMEKTWKESNIMDRVIDTSHSRAEFTASDHSKYTETFADLTGIIDILNSKRIIEINLYFVEQVLDCSILIRIKNSETGPAYVKVEGQDKEWVNDTIKIIDNFFSGCRDQTAILKNGGILIVGITILLLNFFLNNSIEVISKHVHLLPKYAMLTLTKDWRFYIILLSLITISPALLIYRMLRKLWPGIEIQTGNDLEQIEIEKRTKVWLIILTILIPTLLSFLIIRL